MRPNTVGLTGAVAAALAADIGIQVASTVITFPIPPEPINGVIPGWAVVHSIPGGGYLATLANPNQLTRVIMQVDSLGVTGEQAEWVADAVAHCLLDRDGLVWRVPIATATGVVMGDRIALQPGGLQSSAERNRPVFWKSERYEFSLQTTP